MVNRYVSDIYRDSPEQVVTAPSETAENSNLMKQSLDHSNTRLRDVKRMNVDEMADGAG
jgi:hypothetical protein